MKIARYSTVLAVTLIFMSASQAIDVKPIPASKETFEVARMLQGTAFVIPMNQSRQGIVDTCGFEFKALEFDNAYKVGNPFVLSGSFGIRKFGKEQISINYKVGTFNNLGGELLPDQPHSAWMKFGKLLIRPTKRVDAETKGYALYVANLPEDIGTLIEVVGDQQEVLVGFNRRPNGLDVIVPLDMSVRDTKLKDGKVVRVRDASLGVGFLQCLTELLADDTAR